jgi:hypothetical protein
MDEPDFALFVQRYRNSAAQQTAEERRDPFGTVFAPEQNAVAFAYAARFKLAGELTGCLREAPIGPSRDSQPALMRNRDLTGSRWRLI